MMSIFDMDKAPDRFDVCAAIIESEISEYSKEVKDAVSLYALGNPGAASLLSQAVKTHALTTKIAVDRFVDNVGATGSDLYVKLKNT